MNWLQVRQAFFMVVAIAGVVLASGHGESVWADEKPAVERDGGQPPAENEPSKPAAEKSGFADVGGGKIYYETTGDGPVMVLLHDGLLHREVWDRQIPVLSKGFKIVCYDRRGFGRSAAPKEAYSDVNDLEAFLRFLQVDRAVLIGGSEGSGVAIEFALAHPETVDALVLVSPTYDSLGYSLHFRNRSIANSGADIETAIERWGNDKYLTSPQNAEARQRLRELLRANPQNLNQEKFRFAKEPAGIGLKRLESIHVPTLLIVGENDTPDVHAHTGAIESRIRGSRRMVVPDAGHLAYLEKPDAFNRIVLDFLSLIDRPIREQRSTSEGSAVSRRRHARQKATAAADGAAAHRFESGYAPVEGTALYYETLGDGPPLVLIHGGLVDHRMWDQQFDVLSKRFHVIRYDLRGYGLSKSPPGTYRETDDLRALLKHLGIGKAHIMGLSLGGLIGIDFTLEHPEMVASLIPVGPGLSGYEFKGEDVREQFRQTRLAYMQADWDRVVSLFEQEWLAGPSRKVDEIDPTLVNRIHQMGLASFQPGDLGHARRPQPPAVGRLSEIHAPTMAIVGELDVPEILLIVDRIANEVEGAKKTPVPGAAHMVNMEKPAEFNRIVLEFLPPQ